MIEQKKKQSGSVWSCAFSSQMQSCKWEKGNHQESSSQTFTTYVMVYLFLDYFFHTRCRNIEMFRSGFITIAEPKLPFS